MLNFLIFLYLRALNFEIACSAELSMEKFSYHRGLLGLRNTGVLESLVLLYPLVDTAYFI